MAEVAEERNQEIEQRVAVEVRDEESSEDESDYDPLQRPNSSLLPELNLLIVVLSLCPSPSEDDLDHTAHKEMEHVKVVEPRACFSRLHGSKRREINPPNFAGRQAQRFQPTTRDCRHGRKL
uniref:Uncharacterized protein n=1 Tax=Rhizophora mucronata TaxID=61149 RepID=A0A2P2ITX3_RHIMU